MKRLTLCLLCLSALSCEAQSDTPSRPDPTWQQTEPAAVPTACAGSDEARRRQAFVHDVTMTSIHELVTCGGAQVAVSRGMVLTILRSNPGLITGDLASYLGVSAADGLKHQADGSWRMTIPGLPASTMDVRLRDAQGKQITANAMRIDSYLTGVKVERDLTNDQMDADTFRKATWTFHWQGLGPLAGLLNGGKPVPNPFVLKMSAEDLGDLMLMQFPDEDLGPFESLLDLSIEGDVHLVQSIGAGKVDYRMTLPSQTIRKLGTDGTFTFGTLDLTTTDGTVTETFLQHDLRFTSDAKLAGKVRTELKGAGGPVQAQVDFGKGVAYPDQKWLCP